MDAVHDGVLWSIDSFFRHLGSCLKNQVDSDTELKSTVKEKTCEVPDRNIITVGPERFLARRSQRNLDFCFSR